MSLEDLTASPPVDDSQVMMDAELSDDEAMESEEEDFVEYVAHRNLFRRLFIKFGSCGISMVVHLAGLVLLGLLTFAAAPPDIKVFVDAIMEERLEDDPVEIELEKEIEAATEQTMSVITARPMAGAVGGVTGAAGGGASGVPTLDSAIMEETATAGVGEISIEAPLTGAPTFQKLVEAVPDEEFKGDPRAIIDDYQQAMDRIAQELAWMMDKGPVMVIWAFDESESMKDDQKEIRDRVNNVYVQLGLIGRDKSQYLTTSIVSYGESYRVHTRRPTADLTEISAAIDAVPVDKSGKEYMCEAIGRAVMDHRGLAQSGNRQMAMIVVTDESGEIESNEMFLERALAEAKAAKCRIYVLGRESVFGYPFAHIRWQHPQTRHVHWLPINRGPETGFVEQLQTDGFHRRYDAFPAGFGPYEQCRLARETGGIFFMLPSLESNLVRGEKRHYELDILRPYRPDLRARVEVLADRDRFPLRTVIWKCIYDLNPYVPEIARQIEMRVHFSPRFDEFVLQARQEQLKAQKYLIYLATVQKALEAGRRFREQEADPRWQANYDLIYAQLIAYQARTWEYGASLEAFVRQPKIVPLTKPPDLRLVHWDVVVRRQTLTEESKSYIQRADELFQVVIDNHPGTPWAYRADYEKKRGYGIDLLPDYWHPDITPPGGVTVPIPKM